MLVISYQLPSRKIQAVLLVILPHKQTSSAMIRQGIDIPNAGNPGITFLNDQVGVLARSMEDILTFDSAFLNLEESHANVKLSTPKVTNIRVGLPQYPGILICLRLVKLNKHIA